jgi:archaellum component FlaF (FlaF/FlaG flagellin family)
MLFLMVAAASAANSTSLSSEDALSQVYVSSVTVDPQEFYPYEEGTITVQVTNSGSQSVAFENADILDNNIYIEDEAHNPYRAMTYLGPDTTMTYTFKVVAKPPEGTYFPLFTLASRDAGSLRYPIMIKIDSRPVESSFSLVPDNFAINNTDTVNLTINNPRESDITNVVITPEGTGFGISPDKVFLDFVPSESSVNVPFAITPYKETAVNFSIRYNNGPMNLHSDSISLPLVIGPSKTAALPVINNLALTTPGAYYQLTGDVTNTGITDATGVTLTTGAPVVPVEPFGQYAVGSLTTNDFSSFTLTFTGQDLSAVPITVQWKDASGNSLSSAQTFDLRSLAYASGTGGSRSGSSGSGSTGSAAAAGYGGASRGGGSIFGIGGGRAGGLSAFYPVIAGGIIVIVAIVLYIKRKWIRARFRKQQ